MIEPTVLPDPAPRAATTPRLVLRATAGPDTGSMWLLDGSSVAGREAALRLADPSVSRRHVQLDPRRSTILVTDLGSTSGTRLNGAPVHSAVEMRAGDVVTLGSTELMALQPVAVSATPSTWSVDVSSGGRTREVPLATEATVGRDARCEIVIDDPRVSSTHLRLTPSAGGVEVVDLGSSNGTRVQGRTSAATITARDGDIIEVGAPGNSLTVRRCGTVPASVEVRVRADDCSASETIVVDAEPASRVGDIAAALCRESGVVCDAPTVYRRRDGVILNPEDRWEGSGVRRGDELTIVALPPSWPSRLRSASRGLAPTSSDAVPSLPRATLPPVAHRVHQPTPPESPGLRGRGLGWQILGGLAAVSVGLVIAIVRPAYALFGIVAATAGALALGAGILADQSRRKGRATQFRRELRDLDQDLATARHDQGTSYRELSPEADELARRVRHRDPRLWGRRAGHPDALHLRVGLGDRPTLLELGTSFRTGSPLESELTDLIAGHRLVRNVPICVPADSVPSMGLIGDTRVVDDLVARMVVEAACLHPPTDVRIWVLDPQGTWGWARWLPHCVGSSGNSVAVGPEHARLLAAELLTILRREPESATAQTLHLVVVPASDRPPGVDEIVTRMPGRGLMLVTGRSSQDLPSGLAALLQIGRNGVGTLTGVPESEVSGTIAVDGMSTDVATRIAIDMAPLMMNTRRSDQIELPGLCGLHGVDASELDIARLWAESRFVRVAATLAVDDDGTPVLMAMREHGPHGVIAGITGSGKSELLLSLLAAMALTHSPEDLNLFLIDYKGGATFAPLERLPHIAGLVTDLETDGDMVGRAFTALDAEIRRRKQLLADAGVPNIIEYQRLAAPPEPMPDLLVVIDEFAELVRQREDVRGRLDTVATQGRSLGVHLLLACQSPTGAVSHAVRTNTNLWICLRVGRDEESREMLGSVAAARLDDQARGRGFIRRGAGGDLLGFQAVRVTAPLEGRSSSVTAHRPGRPPRRSGAPSESTGVDLATELDVIVDASLGAVQSEGLAPARSLWLQPLPDDILASELEGEVDVPVDRLVAHLGIVDRPDLQRQDPYLIDLTSVGSAMMCGQLGFGKSTALRRLAVDLAGRHGPADLHIYGLDAGSGSLAEISNLPHCAGVVGVEDSDRMMRLLLRLTRLMTSRRAALASAGGSTFVQWRAGRVDAPWVVLLLDDLATFRENSELPGAEQPMELFSSLLQGGPSVGIHLVVGVAQPMDLRLSQLNLIPERVMFRQAEAADYALIGARFSMTNQPMGPPGRAMIDGGHQLQVVRSVADDVGALASRWSEVTAGRPTPIRRLSAEVRLDPLRSEAAAGSIVLGVGGPELEPVLLDLTEGASVLAVAGPHGSGRSTTLVAIYESVVSAEPTARLTLVGARPGPLGLLADHRSVRRSGFSAETACAALDELLELADLDGEVLLVDDAGMVASMVGERLDQILRKAATSGLRCVVSARSGELASSFDSWARYVAGLRRVLLLQPSREDAYSSGVPLPGSVTRWPPGRGLLVNASHGELVQVAVPEILEGG